MSEAAGGWGVTSRILSFDRERGGGPSMPDYMKNYDHAEARERITALAAYVETYAAGIGKSRECGFEEDSQDNGFTLARRSGEKLLVRCYGNDIFDLVRFPAMHEVEQGQSLFHEMALDLDTDIMITLVRRFVDHGNFEDDNA